VTTTDDGASALYHLDVLGARALRTLAFGVGDLLAFSKIVELDALEGFGMEEDIFFRRRFDESESFVRQLLDRAFGHERSSNLKTRLRSRQTIAEGTLLPEL
jgi:hypothetical protein